MPTRLTSVVIDAADPSALARFWSTATGWPVTLDEPDEAVVEPPEDDQGRPTEPGILLVFVAVDDEKTVKNRVHLDLNSTSPERQAELVERVRRAGATPLDIGQGAVPWVVLADPEGNEFCVLDPRYRDFYASRGWPTERWIELGLELDNRVIGDRRGVTFGFHLCRGNQASRWLVEGGYEAVAEQIFGGIHARRLLLEYDDPRSGGFEPLARVPTDRWVVLGLVTTKHSGLESVDDLARRIEAASEYVPLERLAVSPQCGFATSVLGNALTIDEEQAKLARVAAVARKVWG